MKTLLENLPDDHELVRMTYNEQAPMLYRDQQTADNKAKLILSCKSLRWAGEREWRLIRPEIGKAEYGSAKAISAVYLGSRITEKRETAIRKALLPLKIRVGKMKLDTYALAFETPKRLILKKKQ